MSRRIISNARGLCSRCAGRCRAHNQRSRGCQKVSQELPPAGAGLHGRSGAVLYYPVVDTWLAFACTCWQPSAPLQLRRTNSLWLPGSGWYLLEVGRVECNGDIQTDCSVCISYWPHRGERERHCPARKHGAACSCRLCTHMCTRCGLIDIAIPHFSFVIASTVQSRKTPCVCMWNSWRLRDSVFIVNTSPATAGCFTRARCL